MSTTWSTLLGAIVGGAVALAGTLVLELRRDKRRRLGAARLLVSQLRRMSIELEAMTEDPPAEGTSSWREGPHRALQTSAWDQYAAEFVAQLDQQSLETVDGGFRHLSEAADWGFTHRDGKRLMCGLADAEAIVEPFSKPTWLDRHVWRL